MKKHYVGPTGSPTSHKTWRRRSSLRLLRKRYRIYGLSPTFRNLRRACLMPKPGTVDSVCSRVMAGSIPLWSVRKKRPPSSQRGHWPTIESRSDMRCFAKKSITWKAIIGRPWSSTSNLASSTASTPLRTWFPGSTEWPFRSPPSNFRPKSLNSWRVADRKARTVWPWRKKERSTIGVETLPWHPRRRESCLRLYNPHHPLQEHRVTVPASRHTKRCNPSTRCYSRRSRNSPQAPPTAPPSPAPVNSTFFSHHGRLATPSIYAPNPSSPNFTSSARNPPGPRMTPIRHAPPKSSKEKIGRSPRWSM